MLRFEERALQGKDNTRLVYQILYSIVPIGREPYATCHLCFNWTNSFQKQNCLPFDAKGMCFFGSQGWACME